jgi:hypothetical protein
MLYMDVGCDSSSPAWLESREVAHEEVLKSRPGSPREFFDGATTAGESPSRTPRSHRENKRVVKKGVEVEIPAIRFMLEFRTPSERERINIMETPPENRCSARTAQRWNG